MNLNKVFIIGRLTTDPEVRTTPAGDRVTTLGIATNRVWNDKSGAKKQSTEFHNVVLWGRQADVAGQFLIKGSMVFIEGRLQTRSWQGKDGSTRKITEVVGERMQLGPRPGHITKTTDNILPELEEGDVLNSDRDSFMQDNSEKEEVPIIKIEDDGEIKPEDLPF